MLPAGWKLLSNDMQILACDSLRRGNVASYLTRDFNQEQLQVLNRQSCKC